MKLSTRLFGQTYNFKNVKGVPSKANEPRSGDVLAGVAAQSSQERIAAKQVLSELTLADLRENPVIPYEEDCVTRIIQDGVNETAYGKPKNWTVSELREFVLSDEITLEELDWMRKGLTSEMVAAVAKICSNGDLMYGGKKMPVVKRANTTVGGPVPSAPACSRTTRAMTWSIAAQIYEGLSYGSAMR